ncbi:hypothetical protein RN001_014765 [Aquatica leii]|uniref:UDP-glucuronosyltransferase n=1 Tax=Aquatica leii TaxID=1421715 RepID=A0AAN7P2D2_9COLE|nr:hypothetical protein RN001_014765 [Aquatica leii]
MYKLVVVFCVIIVAATIGDTARILGIVPTPSYSHQVVFQPIWKELSLRGHQVTTITTDPINDPALVNLTEIDMHFFYQGKDERIKKIMHKSVLEFSYLMMKTYHEMAHVFLSHQNVQNLIKNDTEKFDVVMVELGVTAIFAFAKRFNAPLIVISSMDAPSFLQSLMGNPTHPIVYPDMIFETDEHPTIWERLVLTGFSLLLEIVKIVLVAPQQSLIDKYFGPNYPTITELQQEISLALVNSDPIFHKVKPLLPTIVQFGGGSHRTTPKPLPEKLRAVLDASQNGFIYFSLGSNVKSEILSNDKQKLFMETFAELPYTVLWKFENDSWPNKPKNVYTSKWFPQQDIFKHSNIKLFITQGGLQSIDEAIYDHVPMVVMPFFGDQPFNAKKIVKKGFGLSLNYPTLTKKEFKETILGVINNPQYRNKIKKLAELASDQPMTGLEKAIWWTEYVIRHNGTKHLRSPLLDIPFYQYYFLDIILVVATALLVLISFVFFTLKLLCKVVKMLIPIKKLKKS